MCEKKIKTKKGLQSTLVAGLIAFCVGAQWRLTNQSKVVVDEGPLLPGAQGLDDV